MMNYCTAYLFNTSWMFPLFVNLSNDVLYGSKIMMTNVFETKKLVEGH